MSSFTDACKEMGPRQFVGALVVGYAIYQASKYLPGVQEYAAELAGGCSAAAYLGGQLDARCSRPSGASSSPSTEQKTSTLG